VARRGRQHVVEAQIDDLLAVVVEPVGEEAEHRRRARCAVAVVRHGVAEGRVADAQQRGVTGREGALLRGHQFRLYLPLFQTKKL
jgi:hypothetical protein